MLRSNADKRLLVHKNSNKILSPKRKHPPRHVNQQRKLIYWRLLRRPQGVCRVSLTLNRPGLSCSTAYSIHDISARTAPAFCHISLDPGSSLAPNSHAKTKTELLDGARPPTRLPAPHQRFTRKPHSLPRITTNARSVCNTRTI